jgi:hypothetical protein
MQRARTHDGVSPLCFGKADVDGWISEIAALPLSVRFCLIERFAQV